MALLVQKYGGTSVGTPERIQAVAARVARARRRGDDVVVVVSAMGHTTDEMIELLAEKSMQGVDVRVLDYAEHARSAGGDAPPRDRHLTGSGPGSRRLPRRGVGPAGEARAGRDLARRATAVGTRRRIRIAGHQPLEAAPAVAAVDVDRHGYQFSTDLVRMAAMSSSDGVFGQVASSRCCFMVPGTRSGTSASV